MQQELASMDAVALATNPSTPTPSDGQLLQAGMFVVRVVLDLKAANQWSSQLTPANVDAAIVNVCYDSDATFEPNGSNAVSDDNQTDVSSTSSSCRAPRRPAPLPTQIRPTSRCSRFQKRSSISSQPTP